MVNAEEEEEDRWIAPCFNPPNCGKTTEAYATFSDLGPFVVLFIMQLSRGAVEGGRDGGRTGT